jgi:hypothetical protein
VTLIADLDHQKYEIPDGWDWRAMIPSWTRCMMGLEGFPGWDKAVPPIMPPFVLVTLVYPRNSRDLAIVTDGCCAGLFSYRDWMQSGTPGVVKGDTYWSGFWFELLTDAKVFEGAFGGIANWMPGYAAATRLLQKQRSQQSVTWD